MNAGQMDHFKSFIGDFVSKEKLSRDPTSDRGFVDAFLRAQESNLGDYFLDDQLVISVLDLFTGGSGTMSKTLAYAFLFMVKNQEWQGKVREEIRQFQQGNQSS